MIRAFVALPVPPEMTRQLVQAQHMLPLVRRVPPENFHVTLAFLDAQPEPVLEALHDRLCGLSSPPLTLEVSGLAVFGGDKPRLIHAEIAPNAALARLHNAVTRAAHAAGIPLKHRRFRPHITLSRDRPQGADLARLTQALQDLAGVAFGSFAATEMTLCRSTLLPAGPRYDALASYALVG